MRVAGITAAWMLVGGFAAARLAGAGALPPTHVAMFDSVAGTVTEQLIPPGSVPPGRTLELATPLPGDTLSILERRLVQRLRDQGITVRILNPIQGGTGDPGAVAAGSGEAPEGAGTALRLEARVESKGVAYLRRINGFPRRTKGFERLVSLQAQARLLDAGTGEVLWARDGAQRATDIVRAGDVEAAASSGMGLFRPGIPPRKGIGFLEPVIVGGIVAGLIILFYSNRT